LKSKTRVKDKKKPYMTGKYDSKGDVHLGGGRGGLSKKRAWVGETQNRIDDFGDRPETQSGPIGKGEESVLRKKS